MRHSASIAPSVAPAHEKIPLQIYSHASDASREVAAEIATLIRSRQKEGKHCVLGLATGSSPTSVYRELVRLHREEGLSFKNVVTFNLDEYHPMRSDEPQSYVRFMREHLFDDIDIDPNNINIPDGAIAPEEIPAFCQAYERKIRDAGGIDIQLLGIGRSGHVGFNEPGSPRDSRTRLIVLDRVTRLDAAAGFLGEENVPRRAITMGIGTILDARRVLLLAFGEGKARVIANAVEGLVTSNVPATYLQLHSNVKICLDPAAAAHLLRTRCPWTVTPITQWSDLDVRNAVIWLALDHKKSILELVDEDYNEAGLQDLLAAHGSAYEINLDVFRYLQSTVTGWPGGKPSSEKRPGDIDRPGDNIFPKRVVVFSPHPDDDVISMGGTLSRLCDQGHEVHVAYQTSGNIAVFDHDVRRFADFARHLALELGEPRQSKLCDEVLAAIAAKTPGQIDVPQVRRIKGLIRRGEATAGALVAGIAEERIHFLDLPFYETGTIKKEPVGEADVAITVELLRKIKPQQIYAAGDLSDPHGTHRVCLDAIIRALRQVKDEEWMKHCEVWLYRGAWQEWEPQFIEMAVPLSPDEVQRKREAIFRHQSQKDRAMFPGVDPREFWQRAEDRNRETARTYDDLGLPKYAALEAFVRLSSITNLGLH